jgi:hypothetical protein
MILEIIQGPMTSPRRLDEAIRGTKFAKRLLAFYRPLNHRYSSQPIYDVGIPYPSAYPMSAIVLVMVI